jgi:SAM-dependent methyltransferase
MMKNSNRWNKAQSYEKGYWKSLAEKITSDPERQLTWYDWKASEFEKKLNAVGFDRKRYPCRILEVGSGPMGVVSYMKWGERYALDPLGDFYRQNKALVALRDGSVNYITGSGEEIPFPDGHFSVVIIDNVLDHVRAPGLVMKEIHRVLSKDGLLYLELNIHTFWGYLLHSLLAKLQIDKGHPYSFTAQRIRDFLSLHRFEVRSELVDDYFQARNGDRRSNSVRARIKGYTGLSEFIYCASCFKKRDSEGKGPDA